MSLHTWMTPLRQSLQAAWAGRSPRERVLLAIGVWVLSLAALWMLALAPALRTWQEAPARQAQLDTQSQRMRQLQAQAQGLQKPRAIARTDAALWLEKKSGRARPQRTHQPARRQRHSESASRPGGCLGPLAEPGA